MSQMPRLLAPAARLIAAALLGLMPLAAAADDFAAPAGDVILTVTGQIASTNGPAMLRLDAAQISALPQHEFTTSTTWTEGAPTFQGVLLKDLIAAIGATGTTVELTALNDYKISIPMGDVRGDGPLLAVLMDGKPMAVRDKGPIWLVYPYDSNSDYRTELTYARSIWQLDRIAFVE